MTGTDFKSLGYYSLSVAITMFLISLGFFNILGSTLPFMTEFAVMWLWWAVLFSVFFLTFGLGKTRLTKFTGWFTIVTAFVTILYPQTAYLNFLSVGW